MGLVEHPVWRCDTCEFWAHGDQWRTNDSLSADDQIGTCHRNAPRATVGDFEYRVLEFLAVITNRYKQEVDWEEATLKEASWPSTRANDWCGEWMRRIRAPSAAEENKPR